MRRLKEVRHQFHDLVSAVQSGQLQGDIFYLRLKAIEHSLITLLAEAADDELIGLRKFARELRATVVETD